MCRYIIAVATTAAATAGNGLKYYNDGCEDGDGGNLNIKKPLVGCVCACVHL